jgi:hypothetical protein
VVGGLWGFEELRVLSVTGVVFTRLAAAPGVIAPLAIGAVLMAMIYAGGHISGAHYNPAVTLGVFLRGRCPGPDVLPYWGAQLLGAVGAAWIVGLALRGAPVSPFVAPVIGAFLAEFFFTFALVYVPLNVATADATDGNSYFGLAIGFTVLAGAFPAVLLCDGHAQTRRSPGNPTEHLPRAKRRAVENANWYLPIQPNGPIEDITIGYVRLGSHQLEDSPGICTRKRRSLGLSSASALSGARGGARRPLSRQHLTG